MKRLLLLVAICLVPSGVLADGFCGSIAEYRDQIKRRLNVKTSSTSYLSDTVANMFVREALVTMVNVIHADKTVWTITTSYRQNTYDLDSTALGVISAEWSYNDSVKSLIYVPRSQFYQMGEQDKHKKTSGQTDGYDKRPSYYDFSDDQLFLYPVPTTTTSDTIRVLGWQKLSNIDTATDLSAIPEVYRPVILKYAIYLITLARTHPDRELFYRDYSEAVRLANITLNARGLPGVEIAPKK